MLELTILSPHRDDAAFSLSVAMSHWSKLGIKLTVANFFSRTEYAPRALSTRTLPVSEVRAREDRSALYSIDRRIQIESLGLLDAPLRFNIRVDAVSRPETGALRPATEIEALAGRMRKYFVRGLVLAPLGLGDHVDHVAVNGAAVASSVDQRLGFYEDLPYATWTSESSLCMKLRNVEQSTRLELKSAIIRSRYMTAARKRQIVNKYQSQINASEAHSIATYVWKYGRGERIWIPKYGSCWKSLIQ